MVGSSFSVRKGLNLPAVTASAPPGSLSSLPVRSSHQALHSLSSSSRFPCSGVPPFSNFSVLSYWIVESGQSCAGGPKGCGRMTAKANDLVPVSGDFSGEILPVKVKTLFLPLCVVFLLSPGETEA